MVRNTPTRPQIPDIPRILEGIGKLLETEVEIAAKAFMSEQSDMFKERIRRQQFVSFQDTPLSQPYLRRKVNLGGDSRVMIATATYVDGIQIFTKKLTGRRKQYRIGFHWLAKARTLKGKVSPILLHDLGVVQEYGAMKNNLPSRPHWRPYKSQTFVPATVQWRKEAPRQILARVRDVYGDKVEITT